MKIDPSNNVVRLNPNNDPKAESNSAKGQDTNSNDQNAGSQLDISNRSKKIQQLSHELLTTTPIDRERVEEVKKKLQNLELDIQADDARALEAADRIAEKLINLENLFNKG